jgi:hypothetical protein
MSAASQRIRPLEDRFEDWRRVGLRSRQQASAIMSILKLLGKHTFDVDTTKTLASAFDAAWLALQTSGSPFAADNRAAATRELLAERLIEIAHRGERDRQRLVAEALAQFSDSN